MLINFPNQLTSEEEQLLKKIAKMKKKVFILTMINIKFIPFTVFYMMPLSKIRKNCSVKKNQAKIVKPRLPIHQHPPPRPLLKEVNTENLSFFVPDDLIEIFKFDFKQTALVVCPQVYLRPQNN